MIILDVDQIFNRAGGPKALLALLDRHVPGHELPYATVQMWRQRDALPSRWLPAVLYALSREGYAMTDFFVDPDEEI